MNKNTKPAEMILHEDTVDISQITDPTLRALMENLVRQTKEREEQLQAELRKIQAELEESKRKELKYQPLSAVWKYTSSVPHSPTGSTLTPLSSRPCATAAASAGLSWRMSWPTTTAAGDRVAATACPNR